MCLLPKNRDVLHTVQLSKRGGMLYGSVVIEFMTVMMQFVSCHTSVTRFTCMMFKYLLIIIYSSPTAGFNCIEI